MIRLKSMINFSFNAKWLRSLIIAIIAGNQHSLKVIFEINGCKSVKDLTQGKTTKALEKAQNKKQNQIRDDHVDK